MNTNFCLESPDGKVCLENFKGKWVILYFYPKDNTSGCTREAIGFSEKIEEIHSLNTEVIGISPDSIENHRNFIKKHNLKIILLSDIHKEVLKDFGVWQLKKMYGREYYGVVRSTFIISPEGNVIKEWRKVKINGHVDEVIDTLKALISK